MSDAIAAIGAPAPVADEVAVTPATHSAKKEGENEAMAAFAGALASAMTLLQAAPVVAKQDVPVAEAPSGVKANVVAKPSVAQADLESLTPEMRTRLERVVARMKAEYGHDVQVVETQRTPERQQELYAQGRTRPGPVVTWTLDSRHITGKAADVVVDASFQGGAAYDHLARIAQEEGLHTLGPKDPGHVELARSIKTAADTAQPLPPTEAKPASVTGDTLAPVAHVANVAHVAEVARVADVTPVAPKKTAPKNTPPLAEPVAKVASSDTSLPAAAVPVTSASVIHLAGAGVPAVLPSEAAERVARVLQLQDSAVVRSPTSVLLRFDDPNNGVSSVRVGLRGNSVDAALGFINQSDATRAESRFGELQQALGRHGLSGDSLTARALTSTEAVTLAAFSGDGTRREQNGSSPRQGAEWLPRERQSSAAYDDQRRQQRSRRQSTDQQQ